MPTRLGIGSYTFGWAVGAGQLSAMQILGIASQHGIGLVQLCNNLPAETFDDDRLDELKHHANARGITIELGTAGSDPEHLRKMIRVAQRLGSPILRDVLDSAGDEPSAAEAAARINGVLPDLRAAGITLAIENHDRFASQTLADVIEQCDDEYVGICLDTVNSMGVPEGPRQVVAALAPHTVNLHLKDFVVRRVPSMQGFTIEGRPAGEGMLGIPWLLGEIQRHQRPGRPPVSAIVEIWSSPLETMDKTIQREHEWAMRSIANLRSIGLR